MEIFSIVPIMAALANLSCLLENIRRDHRFHKLMTAFYLAIGVLLGMSFWNVLKSVPFREVYVTAISAFTACSFITFLLFHSYGTKNVLPTSHLNLKGFGLSKQEIRICELLEEGNSRNFIQLVLNVSNGTLRNHLKNIYAKVLPELKSNSKDQLQRLTVFLSKQKEKR
ncbi:helix-turn-helix transcriptional regulator [Leptospira kmetyi]|uniref:helix-turn-helix transcriptional regulator n=1 Tax=Leptospira kmetyi TaxID=408139 RepID=UPI001FEF5983|nr:LuxR C-terminal-related transcriptional regulator [Leptospira kmetyi]